jgi:transposase InsO family protein
MNIKYVENDPSFNSGDSLLKERSSNFYDALTNSNVSLSQVEVEQENAIPKEYADYVEAFNEKDVAILPPQRSFDLAINLKDPEKSPPFLKIYSLSLKEESILKSWIEENLKKGFIRPSKSPAAAPIFFVPKKDSDELRPCIDYRELNNNSVRDGHPLPLISDVFSKFSSATIFTKLDLKGAYNLVRIKSGDEWKAAFRCKYGQFEPLVVQFGLMNAPAVFQRFVNSLFPDLIDIHIVIYLDDILIFSEDMETHVRIVKEVLKRLIDHQLVLKKSKCIFHSRSLTFLGHTITTDGIRMETDKIEAIDKFMVPLNVKKLRSFLGLANYYRRFIKNFSDLALPLTNLTRKSVQFNWSPECQTAFEQLKEAIKRDVVLQHPQLNQKFYLFTDASDAAVGAVLSQIVDEAYRPVEFLSRKLLTSEMNYSVYDKELLAIVEAFKNWRHFLIHSPIEVEVFCDHHNLKFFRNNQLLKPRHARWAEFLSQFCFKIVHISGKENLVADALSRSQDSPKDKEHAQLIDDSLLKSLNLNPIQTEHDWPEDVARMLESPDNQWNCDIHEYSQYKNHIKNFAVIGGKLYFSSDDKWKRLYLPINQRTAALERFHDNLAHLGVESVKDLIKRRYYWPSLLVDLKDYIRNCPKCQLARNRRSVSVESPARPVPPVAVPFERFGIDFMQNLPLTKLGNRHLITCVDYATRWIIARPVPEMSADQIVAFLYEEVILNFGAPFELISDRGASFLSETVQQFLSMNSIKHVCTSPYHPQTNGMIERIHSMVNHSIKTLTQSKPFRWDEFVGQTLFALRIRRHSVTKNSPFFLLYGVEPRLPGDTAPPRQIVAPLDPEENQRLIDEVTNERLEELGIQRKTAFINSKTQADSYKRTDIDDYYFEINDWVKMKNFGKKKFQFSWKGPFVIVGFGYPGTYWLQKPNGERLPALINQKKSCSLVI